jgi:flagellin
LTGADAAVNTLDISTITDAGADLQKLNAMTQMVDQSISRMTTAASNLGAGKARVSLQQSFVSSLKDSIDKGVGALVDADMNSESTKLQALQVQQQLGVQALSIANQSSQAILKLFG